jgi:hypothetical protein
MASLQTFRGKLYLLSLTLAGVHECYKSRERTWYEGIAV